MKKLALKLNTLPKHTNAQGQIFGGWILDQMNEAALITTREFTDKSVPVALTNVRFNAPVEIGQTVSFYQTVEKIGATSITIKINVETSDWQTGKITPVTEGVFTYVDMNKHTQAEPGKYQFEDLPDMEPLAIDTPQARSGNFFGHVGVGWVLALMDHTGAAAAFSRAQGPVVTVAMNNLELLAPIQAGDLIYCYLIDHEIGNTSMKTTLDVLAKSTRKSKPYRVARGDYVYVAIDPVTREKRSFPK